SRSRLLFHRLDDTLCSRFCLQTMFGGDWCRQLWRHLRKGLERHVRYVPAGYLTAWVIAGMLAVLRAWSCSCVRNCNRAIRLVLAYGTQISPVRSSMAMCRTSVPRLGRT